MVTSFRRRSKSVYFILRSTADRQAIAFCRIKTVHIVANRVTAFLSAALSFGEIISRCRWNAIELSEGEKWERERDREEKKTVLSGSPHVVAIALAWSTKIEFVETVTGTRYIRRQEKRFAANGHVRRHSRVSRDLTRTEKVFLHWESRPDIDPAHFVFSASLTTIHLTHCRPDVQKFKTHAPHSPEFCMRMPFSRVASGDLAFQIFSFS